MKKNQVILFFIAMAVMALFSCSAPYSISTASPKMLGDWKILSIQTEGEVAGLQIPAPVFDDATISCLATSNWALFDGGGGGYSIKSGDSTCVSGNRKISWEIVNLSKTAHYFQFFRFQAPKGILADRFTTYIMEIALLNKTSLVVKYPIKYQEKTGSLVFTFGRGKN